jgi:hypothetical protein
MVGSYVWETLSSLGREGVTLLSELGNRLGPATFRRSRYGVRNVIMAAIGRGVGLSTRK